MEGIILCGGTAKRMKPYLPFNKALAEIKRGVTLIEHQSDWLFNSGISSIILAVDRETCEAFKVKKCPLLDRVRCSVEEEKLGTGGAVFKAIELVESHLFYVMNVDDILISETFTPINLIKTLK